MDQYNEIWRQIDGYKNYYVSSHGRIKNIMTEKILTPRTCQEGYKRINLQKDGKRKTYHIHRLVAFAFCLNPENKPMVDHIDGDRTNNNATNLRFVTNSENQMNRKINDGTMKGVCAKGTKFMARIKKDGIRYHIGTFKTKEEAGRAYDAVAKELFGVYAKTNF